jgi:hypothetical protein
MTKCYECRKKIYRFGFTYSEKPLRVFCSDECLEAYKQRLEKNRKKALDAKKQTKIDAFEFERSFS